MGAMGHPRQGDKKMAEVHPTVLKHRMKLQAVIARTPDYLRVGKMVVFHTSLGNHIGNGAIAKIVQIELAFTRGNVSNYKDEDYCVTNLEYDVAVGYNEKDGTAQFRWKAKGNELKRLEDLKKSAEVKAQANPNVASAM